MSSRRRAGRWAVRGACMPMFAIRGKAKKAMGVGDVADTAAALP
ncbi:hypothetical protein [Streptomyces scabiei]|nr:hypothetical protein [Streptomyces scabiei]MDX3520522.1 hypothetical protein [Streptomyces scabiei]